MKQAARNYSLFGFDPDQQAFWLRLPGFRLLEFQPGYRWNESPSQPLKWKASPKSRNQWVARNRHGAWKLQFSTPDEAQVEISLICRPVHPPRRLVLQPVILDSFSVDHVLTHGQKMGGCESHVAQARISRPLESYSFAALTRGSHTLQISFPLKQKQMAKLTGHLVGKRVNDLTASTLFEAPHRKVLKAVPVMLTASADPHGQLTSWADTQTNGAPLIAVPQESGWNSWDYYRWTISEEEVLKNAELIASDPVLSRHVRRIIVDDGWQYCYGEWEPNFLFPSGMKNLAKRLTKMGFVPGLWFAPTIVEPHARLAQIAPELLACAPSGIPCLAFSCMERKGFLLDPTHPRVQAWWEELFRRYADYGFRSFKLDFLCWTVPARKFHNSRTAPGDLMRTIIEPIRRAVGNDTRLLGCNFGFEAGRGLVDDVRTSGDIHANWRAVKNNAINIAARFWAHRRLWINDPDFALCRGEETSNDPHLHRLKALLPFVKPNETKTHLAEGLPYMSSLVDIRKCEAEVLLSLVIASGGVMNLSDNLPVLNSTGLRLLRKSVQAEKGNAAIPLDLFNADIPAYWVQKLDSGKQRILLVNWTDAKAELSLDLETLNVRGTKLKNFWTGEPLKTRQGKLTAELLPHACLLGESG